MYRYSYELDNELYHYGVKGQKWGVRKKIDRAYNDWTRNRQVNANAAMKRTSGNKNKAMVRTAAKGVGKAALVHMGSKAARISMGLIGGKTLGTVAYGAGQVAVAAILVNTGVEMYNISKTEPKKK